MKIKRKVQKNLPQLIEWAMDNDIKHRVFESNPNFDGVTYRLGFDKGGDLYFEESLAPTLLFTVEVEEEITEDTELDLIERFIVNNKTYYMNPQTMSINTCLGAAPDDIIITHFYIETDNRELILIWRDGKLVE
ncbi:hypothetical protein [Staphylococcus saprophyticus]|uniref:hypothetical protein n=1 Tax=Staphylococcus saprophyticus TaxID=29385 RepID=UPI0011A42D04|nr:hypothetical protein [Staphylococcus saprophyticus]